MEEPDVTVIWEVVVTVQARQREGIVVASETKCVGTFTDQDDAAELAKRLMIHAENIQED